MLSGSQGVEPLSDLLSDLQRVVLLYTVSYVDKVTRIKGVDQRSGRLDIAARVVQAALCTSSDRVGVLVYSATMGKYVIIDYKQRGIVCKAGEHEVVELIARGLQQSSQCRSIREILEEAKKLNYRIVLLSERGSDTRVYDQKVLYVLGAEIDPPENELRDLIDSIESIGPLSYLASHVVAFINFMYVLHRELKKHGGGPIPAWAGCGAFRTPQPRPTRPA